MISRQLLALDSHIFAIIAELKEQSKRANIDSAHVEVTKTVDF